MHDILGGNRAWAVMSVCRAYYPVVLAVCARAETVLPSSCSRGTRHNQMSRGHVHPVFVALQVCRDKITSACTYMYNIKDCIID